MGVSNAPTFVPELKMPVASARSFFGNHSAVALMAAGKLNFYSDERKGFTFDYEGFNIYLDSIDSLRYILVRNPPDGFEFTDLQRALRNTCFENIKGRIHIDDPKNKNGAKDYRSFPVLDTYDKSYVYWAKDKVQGGVYEKEKPGVGPGRCGKRLHPRFEFATA